MKIILDSDFYTQHAIEKMTELYSDYLLVKSRRGNGFILDLIVKKEHLIRRSEIINTFLNNSLELSIQEKFNYEC